MPPLRWRAEDGPRSEPDEEDLIPLLKEHHGTSHGPPHTGRDWGVLLWLTAVLAACSLLYELVLAQTLTALLGNTVLRYSITIGVYLGSLGMGSMLCRESSQALTERLAKVEIALSVLGGAAVPIFFALDGVQRYFYMSNGPLDGTVWPSIGYLIATHLVIIGIGILSGFEIPLLLRIGEKLRPGSTNIVLGVDYVGALFAAVAFPILLLPRVGLWPTAFSVALLNALAAAAVALWKPGEHRVRYAGTALGSALLLGAMLSQSEALQQHFLKTYFHQRDLESPLAMLESSSDLRPITHYQSAYQAIDLVREEDTAADKIAPLLRSWRGSALAPQRRASPPPDDLWLYLEGNFQFFSGVEAFYHEWFAHVPLHVVHHPPHRALVLGGGDGLLVRELLAYDTVEEVVHVEIDPVMIKLSRQHPALSRLNGAAFQDPRHHLIREDAFGWVRNAHSKFDAVYIDMPYPRDYTLSTVYSREFYACVRDLVAPGGFMILDIPDGDCHDPDSLWSVYSSTIAAAGFPTRVQVTSYVDPGVTDSPYEAMIDEAEKQGRLPPNTEPEELLHRLNSIKADVVPENEFLLAFPSQRDSVEAEWSDWAIRHRALREAYLSYAVDDSCEVKVDPERVNSILRPTLPPLEFVTMRTL